MANTPLVSFRIEKDKRDKFQRLFPYCLSRFLKKAISMAIKNRDFFNQVYFSEE